MNRINHCSVFLKLNVYDTCPSLGSTADEGGYTKILSLFPGPFIQKGRPGDDNETLECNVCRLFTAAVELMF